MGRAVRDSVEVTLRPLREDELPAFVARGRAEYERELVELAGFDAAEAGRKAEADYVPKPEHGLFALEADGRGIGSAWFGEARGRAFIYDIWIEPAERGQGYGRGAMLALEEEAQRRGLAGLDLNVWAGNDVARSLYRSLGYVERGIFMRKNL
jgi:ribosomal protein S18 acetylase RimI-like enzyme